VAYRVGRIGFSHCRQLVGGLDFAEAASKFSEDPGSAKNGGELGLHGRGEMFPEFEAVAFSLKDGEVSEIVETEAGYHIIQLIERRGDYINVRHILVMPKVSPLDLAKAKVQLDSVSQLIQNKKYTFEEAVKKFSEDPSKNNGGILVNPMTGNSVFESDQLDPKVFFVIDKLKVGDISNPVPFKMDDGKDAYRILYLKSRTEPRENSRCAYRYENIPGIRRCCRENNFRWIVERHRCHLDDRSTRWRISFFPDSAIFIRQSCQ